MDVSILFPEGLHILTNLFNETTLCVPVHLSNGDKRPVFIIVENRNMFDTPPGEIDILHSVYITDDILIPFFLFKIDDIIYDWWYNFWSEDGMDLLDALINSKEAMVYYIYRNKESYCGTVHTIYNVWSEYLNELYEDILMKSFSKDISLLGRTKYAIAKKYKNKNVFWNHIIESHLSTP